MVRLLPENTYLADPALHGGLARMLSPDALAWAAPQLVGMGSSAAGELFDWAEEAERTPPVLRSIDPWGDRVDEVVYGDAWRRIGKLGTAAGLVALPYEQTALQAAGAETRLVQAALCYLFAPSSATYSCPVAMTDAAARVLIDYGPGELREAAVPQLVSRDPATAWTAGQWMTEQQGGSDVGANAVEARSENGAWKLYGRKYFCSNVGGEVVLVLARPQGAELGTRGLGLFLLPQLLTDGSRNHYRVDRLKDKLGTRAMATGEVTLEGAEAQLVGELEKGFQQMTPMLNVTRLHNAIASAAALRRGVMLARCYASQREAFGKRLDMLPLQRQVLVELAVQAEGNLVFVLRMAELLGRIECGQASEAERLLFRLGTSLAKLYTAKQAVAGASEAIECFGGAGYMEDTGLGRLLRDAQVLPIWEGTTNVLSLDVTRVLAKPGVWEALESEFRGLGRALRTPPLAADGERVQAGARRLAFELSEQWIGGLLESAATRGEREAEVARLWSRGSDPAATTPRSFHLVVDGGG